MDYNYLLFDLDGTLTEPKEGITRCVQYALEAMGIHEPDREKLVPFIGPPLKEMFMSTYQMDEKTAERAIEKYRERFREKGIFENGVYPGIPEALSRLKEAGKIMAVASSKPQPFVERILEHYGLDRFFQVVVGSELNGRRTDKQEVIQEVFRRFGLEEKDRRQALMIGDRRYDVEGAKKMGVDCLGVTFGYAADGELEEAGADLIVDSAQEMARVILSPIRKIAIIGMGALGILMGEEMTACLGRHQVWFIADRNRQERYRKKGVWFNGRKMDFAMKLPEETAKADLVIVAVKATGLEQAVEDMKNAVGDETTIVSLLNGITSEKRLGEAFGMKKVVWCVAQGMDAVKEGTSLTCDQRGCLCIGRLPEETEKQRKVDELAALFEEAGRGYTVEADIKRRMWAKLMMNVGVNQACMVYETNYGGVQKEGRARDLMIDAMKEVIVLAREEGVPLDETDLNAYLALIDTLTPEGMPSMRQDGLAGRPSEVDLFAGTIRRLGKKHGIPTPVNDWIYGRVKWMEERP